MMCGDRWLETGSPWEGDEMTDREQFEKVFPVPVSMVWNGFTYAIVDAHEISSCWDYQLRWETWQAARATPALPDGMAIVPVERLTAEWANKNVVVPTEVKGRVMSEMFWRGVYAMLAAKEKQS